MTPQEREQLKNEVYEKHQKFFKEWQAVVEKQQEMIGDLLLTWIQAVKAIGGTFYEDVNDMYHSLEQKEMIIRKHALEDIFEKVTAGEPIHVGLDSSAQSSKNDYYANAALWDPRSGDNSGFYNAFMEGRASMNGVVGVMGFAKEAVEVHEVRADAKSVGNINRENVVSVQGDIRKEDLQFLLIRIPSFVMPEKMITDEDEEAMDDQVTKGQQPFVFRGFTF
jgi:hypothetical protein